MRRMRAAAARRLSVVWCTARPPVARENWSSGVVRIAVRARAARAATRARRSSRAPRSTRREAARAARERRQHAATRSAGPPLRRQHREP